MANILEIENELETLLSADKKSWVRIYELMETVDTEKLYEGKFSSYTGWVNALADKVKVHVSLLWSRKKAGKVYAAYEERAREKGCSVPKMDEIKVSADNFNLIEKIAGKNTEVVDELIGKVLHGEMKRSDLKNAWATVKADRNASGVKAVRVNGYDKEDVEISEDKIRAADIVLALSNSDWLADIDGIDDKDSADNKDNKDSFRNIIHTHFKYKLMTEFAVQTGSSRHARRIDALVLENLTVKKEQNYNVNIHAIEIKIDKNDLLSDHKMQEYTDYADYFWIAVPENLQEFAKEIMLPTWGLMIIDEKKRLKIIYKAERNDAVFRNETLETALVKLL